MEFSKHTLPNGLEIIAERNDEAYTTAVGFFVQTGARDETADVAGVSHFLEHMLFKGTPTRTADDVNREFDEMGAHYNAFTTEENTVYYAAVLPEQQTSAVELLADILRPSLRGEDFDTEKQVIVEEIRMYDDQPPFGADDKCRAAFFGDHPLGHSVLGTAQSVSALPLEAMREYFRRRYSPGNISLAAAGRVDFDELVAAATRLCGEWEPVEAGRALPPARGRTGFACLTKDSAAMEYVLQLTDGPTAADEDRYAAKVLAAVIGDDCGSRLFWELVEPGRAEQASLHHYEFQGAGAFMTYLTCRPEAAADNLARLTGVYRQAHAQGLTAAELAAAKSKFQSRVVLSSEKPRGRLFSVGGNWLQRHEYRTVADDLAAIDAVTLDDLHGLLTRYSLLRATTMAIGPAKGLAAPVS